MGEIRSQYTKLAWSVTRSEDDIRKQAAKDQLKILEALGVFSQDELERLKIALDERTMDEID